MTRALLLTLGNATCGGWALLFYVALTLLLLPATLFVDAVRYLIEVVREHRVLRTEEGTCPRGHELALVGTWACEGCGFIYDGHAFARCRHCSARAHAAVCPCGTPVENPLSPVRWTP